MRRLRSTRDRLDRDDSVTKKVLKGLKLFFAAQHDQQLSGRQRRFTVGVGDQLALMLNGDHYRATAPAEFQFRQTPASDGFQMQRVAAELELLDLVIGTRQELHEVQGQGA